MGTLVQIPCTSSTYISTGQYAKPPSAMIFVRASPALRMSLGQQSSAVRCLSVSSQHHLSLSTMQAQQKERLAMTAQEELNKWNANNKKFNRPLSPHLSVYEWSLPMTMSAVYRLTAVSLGFQMLSFPFAHAYFSYMNGVTSPAEWLSNTASAARGSGVVMASVWLSLKGSVVFPLVYHCVNGCRHLGWDQFAYGIRHLTDVYSSGNIVIAVTCLLTAVLTAIHMD